MFLWNMTTSHESQQYLWPARVASCWPHTECVREKLFWKHHWARELSSIFNQILNKIEPHWLLRMNSGQGGEILSETAVHEERTMEDAVEVVSMTPIAANDGLV